MIRKILKYISYTLLGLLTLLMVLSIIWYRSDMQVQDLEPTYFTPPYSSYIQVDDAKLHVRQRGAGPAIFLLHGSFASLHTWNGWENELEKNFHTISVDFPGHGLTGPTASAKYSTDDYAQLIFQLADELKIDTFYVAGNSMGGQVAWKMALHHPQRVKKLILVDAAGYSKVNPIGSNHQNRPFIFTLLQNDVAAKFLVKITPRFLFSWNLKQVYGNPQEVRETDVDRFYVLMMRAGNREATVQRLRQPGKDLQDSIRFITTPTLILWGEKDRWIPVANAYRFQKDIQQSQLIVWQELGHVPMEEQPAKTVMPIIQFLDKKPRSDRQQ